MISRLYSVQDVLAKAFAAPFMSPNDMIVKRSFQEMAASEEAKPVTDRHNYVRYPHEYVVWFVGTFESDSGVIVPALDRLGSAAELIGG